MSKELLWILCPVFSILYLYGGYKQKNWRRLGLPIALLVFSLAFGCFSWWVVLSAFLLGVSLRLPFTLVGDSLYASWVNWVWIWILGFLFGACSIPLGITVGLLFPCLVVGAVGTLSNLPQTSHYFPWKFCEASIGFSLAYPFVLALSTH